MITRELERIDMRDYLSRVRLRNENLHQQRLDEVYEKLPRIWEINLEISKIGFAELRDRLKGQNGSDSYKEEMQSLSEEKKRLMAEAGYPADYLEPIFDCPLCEDWGEVDNRVCECVKKIRINEFYKNSNLHNLLEKENFNTFRLDYYSRDIPSGKQNSPYDNAARILSEAKEYTESFGKGSKGILIYGGTGLGKTFLSNCIAKALLDKENTVLYLSANELFEEVMSTYIMSKSEKDRTTIEPIYEYVYNSDLLIIDDLGTEVLSGFVKSQLFEIINKRIIMEKATLITTNLSLGTLQDRYSERIMSRIADNFTLYTLYGDDIRYKKIKS